MTLKTTNFKKFAMQIVPEKSIVYLLRKEFQLKDNCPFDNYKIIDKYLKVKFLKTWDTMDWIKTMSKKRLKEKSVFDKTITAYYCQNIP